MKNPFKKDKKKKNIQNPTIDGRSVAAANEMWKIDKQFSFCYGHRVWSQKLYGDYCESGDACCKCRHLHGHEGLVHVFLEAPVLERGMVTDFKHLGWLKNFLDDYLDHRFIIDLNDPWFANITGGSPVFENDFLTSFKPTRPLNTSEAETIQMTHVKVPGTDRVVGWELNTEETSLTGPEEEVLSGFFFVNFVPTSENFSKWIYDCVDAKMSLIGVKTAQIDWFETPKSRSSYRRD